MTLYLVRHPQPDVAPGLCYGASDVPVTETELARVHAGLALPLVLLYVVVQRAFVRGLLAGAVKG